MPIVCDNAKLVEFISWISLIAGVFIITALASGLVERSPLSFPLIFLSLGLLLGDLGFGVFSIDAHDRILEVVATSTLALVLFLDATRLEIRELASEWLAPVLILGPGTLLILALGGLGLVFIAGIPWGLAFIGGAALASTDPVVLREIVRDRRIPRTVRQVLEIEAGVNDIIVLPAILILIQISRVGAGDWTFWLPFLGKLLLLGPVVGFLVGGIGSWLMTQTDRYTSVRIEYQSLYGIGLVFASYSAATLAGGDGFLGAFAGGLAVVMLNQKLCECFHEYGQVTAEMAMLFSFVLFGATLSGMMAAVSWMSVLVLAFMVIVVVRPAIIGLILWRVRMSWQARLFISWFGPRGLNTLLLTLLAVQAELAGAELLLATVGGVVLVSAFVHGATATPAGAWYGNQAAAQTLEEERQTTGIALLEDRREEDRISVEKLRQLLSGSNPPLVMDVRKASSFDPASQISGSVRVAPDEIAKWAASQRQKRAVVTYCT